MTQTFEHEYEILRKENEKNVHELQKTYKLNFEKSRPSSSSTRTVSVNDDGESNIEASHKPEFHTPNPSFRLDMKPPMAPVVQSKPASKIIQIERSTQTVED